MIRFTVSSVILWYHEKGVGGKSDAFFHTSKPALSLPGRSRDSQREHE